LASRWTWASETPVELRMGFKMLGRAPQKCMMRDIEGA
jgi:hypothetical protein